MLLFAAYNSFACMDFAPPGTIQNHGSNAIFKEVGCIPLLSIAVGKARRRPKGKLAFSRGAILKFSLQNNCAKYKPVSYGNNLIGAVR